MNGSKPTKRPKTKKFTTSPFDTSDEDEAFDEEEIERFDNNRDYEALIATEEFQNVDTIIRMDARDFTSEYVALGGLKNPIVFTGQQDVLDIKIPPFTYKDVLDRIPQHQRIDMFNHKKEKQQTMAVATIVAELENPSKQPRLGPLNMLSLECSSMEMSKYIAPPRIVREIDWAQRVFPKEKFAHRTYSKVEKYILMTMAQSYTEFHIDFGGTSVWYHVKKGEKHFFLIEPTDENLRIFEEWLSAYRAGTQTGFFGNVVQKCAVVKMVPGQTLILPAGWIHAVYTPIDSLVYGGNFLHEYSISMQKKVREYESRSQIRKKFTYPFYEQTMWYFAADIVRHATGREYVRLIHSNEYDAECSKQPSERINQCYDLKVEPEDFYDKDFTREPKQFKFDSVDDRANDPPTHFNDVYLRSMKKSFRNDLYKIKAFLEKEYDKRRYGRVAEGIRRPSHLLKDFERVIDRVMNMEASDEPQPLPSSGSHKNIKNEVEPTLTPQSPVSIDIPAKQIKVKSPSPASLANSTSIEDNFLSKDTCEPSCSNDSKMNGDANSSHLLPLALESSDSVKSEEQKPKHSPTPPTVKAVSHQSSSTSVTANKSKRKGSTANDKSKSKKAIKLDVPASKSGPKWRREEHLPLPSASSENPLVDDPIFSAIPLGKSSVHNKNRKTNSNGFNTFPKLGSRISASTGNKSTSLKSPSFSHPAVNNSETAPVSDAHQFSYVDGSDMYVEQPQELEFYNSSVAPCYPTSSSALPSVSTVYSTPQENVEHSNNGSHSSHNNDNIYGNSYSNWNDGYQSPPNYYDAPTSVEKPKVNVSSQLLDEILESVEGLQDMDDFM